MAIFLLIKDENSETVYLQVLKYIIVGLMGNCLVSSSL